MHIYRIRSVFVLLILLFVIGRIFASNDIAADNLSTIMNSLPKKGEPKGPETNDIVQNLPDLGDASSYAVSSEDERVLVEELKRQMRKDPDYIQDPLLSDYLNQLGQRLSQAAQQGVLSGRQTFELFGVRDPSINAFAMPGGLIGVHTGLIAAAESESELASVLGHEMGHVLQKHYARGQEKSSRNTWLALAGIALGALAASRSPDMAQGLIAGGQALAVNNMLVFSRDAEREADRVGFQILSNSDLDPAAFPRFFERLQRANALNESSQSYVRTHPLTSERIADMENRVRFVKIKNEIGPSLEYELLRARARVLQANGFDGLQKLQRIYAIAKDTPIKKIGAAYALAIIAQQQGKWQIAEQFLKKARDLLGQNPALGNSVFITVTANELAVQQSHLSQALSLAEQGLQQYPESQAMKIAYVRTLISAKRYIEAAQFAEAQSKMHANELIWWELLAESYARQAKQAEQHSALAERFAQQALWLEALQQLQIARRADDTDFYLLSKIDARINQIKAVMRENKIPIPAGLKF